MKKIMSLVLVAILAAKLPGADPEFVNWPSVREVRESGLGVTLKDIESHLKAGHQYRDNDKITWGHEGTHGVNADVRNAHHTFDRKVNGFYVLKNRGVVIDEPPTTIAAVAANVPKSWQGVVSTYLRNREWNKEPLYLMDEWVAYTNGTVVGQELQINKVHTEGSFGFTVEFTGYMVVLAYTVNKSCPTYNDKQLKSFIMWNGQRAMGLWDEGEYARKRLLEIQESKDAEHIRTFARTYFGKKWCLDVLGF